MYISEFDSYFGRASPWEEDREAWTRGHGHRVHRHCPAGGFPMLVVILNRAAPFLRGYFCRGRCQRLDFSFSASSRFSVVCVHAPTTGADDDGGLSDDFVAFLADVLWLVRSRPPRSRVVLTGDWNTDLMCQFVDPWAAERAPASKHALRRGFLEALFDVIGADIIIPSSSRGCPPIRWSEHVLSCPVSRCPVGAQSGVPSLLDYTASTQGLATDSAIVWIASVGSDHAAISTTLDLTAPPPVPRPRTTWTCSAPIMAQRWLHANASCDTSVEACHALLMEMQQLFAREAPRRARRSAREGVEEKKLLQNIVEAESDNHRKTLCSQLSSLRRLAHQHRRDEHIRDGLNKGRPPKSSKKLRRLTLMTDTDGTTTADPDRWSRMTCKFFSELWCCGEPSGEAAISAQLARFSNDGLTWPTDNLDKIFLRVRRRNHLDSEGVCADSWLLLVHALPEYVSAVLEEACATEAPWRALTIAGRVEAKKPGAVSSHQLRSIVPLPVWAQAVDIKLATDLNQAIDAWDIDTGPEYLEGARKGRQLLDVTFPIGLCLERARDTTTGICVAQAGIHKYFDCVQPALVSEWIHTVLGEPRLAHSFLLLHGLPAVRLATGLSHALLEHRTVGLLTGSRSASAGCRIPLLDIVRFNPPPGMKRGLTISGLTTSFASYVDNLLAMGKTIGDVVEVLDSVENARKERWDLSIGADSRELLPTYPTDTTSTHTTSDGWKVKDHMRVLGQELAKDRGYGHCFDQGLACAIRVFFTNHCAALVRSSLKSKSRFLNTVVRPVLSARWARWAWTAGRAARIVGLQRRLCRILWPISRDAQEDDAAFFLRGARLSARRATSIGCWGTRWSADLLSWKAHLDRGHDAKAWSKPALAWQNDAWLSERRSRFSTLTATRTRTRTGQAGIYTRWETGLQACG